VTQDLDPEERHNEHSPKLPSELMSLDPSAMSTETLDYRIRNVFFVGYLQPGGFKTLSVGFGRTVVLRQESLP